MAGTTTSCIWRLRASKSRVAQPRAGARSAPAGGAGLSSLATFACGWPCVTQQLLDRALIKVSAQARSGVVRNRGVILSIGPVLVRLKILQGRHLPAYPDKRAGNRDSSMMMVMIALPVVQRHVPGVMAEARHRTDVSLQIAPLSIFQGEIGLLHEGDIAPQLLGLG